MADTLIMTTFKHVVAGQQALEAADKIKTFAQCYLKSECWLCDEKVKPSKLKDHVLSVHGVTECFLCNENMLNMDLRAHVLKHREVHCPFCDTYVDFDQIVSHVKGHSDDVLHCPDCQKMIAVETIIEHVKSHSMEKCCMCDEVLEKITMTDHLKIHRIELEHLRGENLLRNNEDQTQTHDGYMLVKCPDCNERINIGDIVHHIKQHQMEPCAICDERVNTTVMRDHLRIHRMELQQFKEEDNVVTDFHAQQHGMELQQFKEDNVVHSAVHDQQQGWDAK